MIVFFVSSGCDNTATPKEAVLGNIQSVKVKRQKTKLQDYSAKLVNEIGAFPSPIMHALQVSKSRSNTAGTVKENSAKPPGCIEVS
jgi:hypothetical protein